VSAADEAQAEELEKYGMPPLVPATVRARVPLVVIGDPATEINPPVKVWATLVTVPVPQAAPCAIWFPFASIFTQSPLVCVPVVVTNWVVFPDRVPTLGATPAPPPMTGRFAVKAPEEAHVLLLEKYGTPPLVPATVKASVPLVVIGEPAMETSPPVNDAATLVTVPPDPVIAWHVKAWVTVSYPRACVESPQSSRDP
jgi:hypothetical protein